MVFEKGKYLIIYIIIGYLINFCSSHANFTSVLVDQNSIWNASSRQIIYPYPNGTITNDSLSLNLSNSGLDINGQTDEIAVLDDLNNRVLILNRSNMSTFFAILSDSSNLTNMSGILYSPSAIIYDNNNSLYILDNSIRQVAQMENPLQYGDNATLTNKSIPVQFNGTFRGLCVNPFDGSVLISDSLNNRIIRYNLSAPSGNIYIQNGTNGTVLNSPTSIVMNNNGTLFVNDYGNNQIKMFHYNSPNGTILPIGIHNCTGLSLYSSDILVITTKTTVYLFNLTNNRTTCAIGCNYSLILNNSGNAVIDNSGSLIVTDSNQIVSYSIYEHFEVTQPPIELTTETTTKGTYYKGFVPPKCPSGFIGASCNTSQSICAMNQPCQNSGNCIENSTSPQGYTCECQWGFNGTNCQNDQRPCKPNTCYPQGTCINITLTNFTCICNPGYQGTQCEKMINLCVNVTCQNHGVCVPQILNYTCNCVTGFSGRFCEITAASTVARTYASKSFAYVAILMLLLLAGFIVFMDLLKYVFGIDPAEANRDAMQKAKMSKKKKKKAGPPKAVYRFRYIH